MILVSRLVSRWIFLFGLIKFNIANNLCSPIRHLLKTAFLYFLVQTDEKMYSLNAL